MNRLKHRKKTTSVRISCWCENFAVNPEKCENSKKMFAFQTGVEIPTPRASLVCLSTWTFSISINSTCLDLNQLICWKRSRNFRNHDMLGRQFGVVSNYIKLWDIVCSSYEGCRKHWFHILSSNVAMENLGRQTILRQTQIVVIDSISYRSHYIPVKCY
jgi:hypothetical protein